ncbi:peroxiredoxin [Clostridium pascui]|uniref:peroxiredoxin-like family protein n=1 Tax=Clostridium pascui TaxID=46609 RepID=UPI00195C2261|nr:peroxiredoxin-like family protein [Clostridium pascui]MBM7871555.1 peroxiredoxin [Clostridium pascui]
MSEKLSIGMKAPDFNFITAWNAENNFYKNISGKKNILIFLRYYGCTACQLQILKLVKNYERFKEKDIQLFVVLQSAPETIREQDNKGEMPFTIICDPSQELYKLYNTSAAKNMLGLGSLNLLKKVEEAKKLGLAHGKYEGNELQLPATFVMDEEGIIKFVHYGQDAGDVPDIDELLKLI